MRTWPFLARKPSFTMALLPLRMGVLGAVDVEEVELSAGEAGGVEAGVEAEEVAGS